MNMSLLVEFVIWAYVGVPISPIGLRFLASVPYTMEIDESDLLVMFILGSWLYIHLPSLSVIVSMPSAVLASG